jgi:hypothetical protein
MIGIAVFVLMHACAGQPSGVADARADYLLSLRRDRTTHEKRLESYALAEMVDVCAADAILSTLDGIKPAAEELRGITAELEAGARRRDARRRFWRRVRRLGL